MNQALPRSARQFLEDSDRVARENGEYDRAALDRLTLEASQTFDAYHRGEGQVIPKDGVQIGKIALLAIPGEARTKFIANMAEQTGRSVEDLTAEADAGTLMVGVQRVDAQPWTGNTPQISPEATAAYAADRQQAASAPQQLNALNISAIIQNADELRGGSVGHYADYLTREAQRYQTQGMAYTFTGSWNDKTTHDVNEYVGWLYQAIGKQAQAKTQTT